ncbi:zinc finger and BTB domain-containing protein 24-like [Sebastes umbrosus]|uniref:zinc finger and BTB domain-containing protein 24-like n=1 Tax=Sebastes umbrosus TaxID=72105 RepID=UPI00189DBDDA|nr:zinc finger and BTB domain-containing protein 24-like [Sebastes umbrosus]
MCSVVGCYSGRLGAQRFRLPEDPERRLEWVQFLLEVNEQRLRESSWTDITVCRHHFTEDCFVNLTPTGPVQLRSGAVPSVCVKTEPDEPEPGQEYEETTEITFQYDEFKSCGSPSSYSGESGLTSTAAQESPAPSDGSDGFMSDYGQMLQKVENIDMIRKKAALLQMKGKYVVNEKRLLQLFSHKCPKCGSKVKTEKVTCGVLLVLNQQCLQCDYRNQWKSQRNASVPTDEDQHLTEVVEVEVTPETQQTASTDDNGSSIAGMPEMVAVSDDESDPVDETEESNNEGGTDSDEDWNPAGEVLLADELLDESEEETDDEEEEEEEEEEDGDLPLNPKHGQLCTECGKFFNNQRPHTCEHKIKPYSCNICGKRCVTEIALNTHSRIHDENYEYPCKYCEVTFKTKVDKITHQQIHLAQGKPYKCPDCSETFATNKQRRIHLKDHRGAVPLKCPICGIDFTYTTSIQRHMAVHTGVKPYKCAVCQRGFTQAGHLKSHMRMHTGERPFKCQRCDKSFNHNVSLKSHVQRYHSSSSGHERKKGKINKTVSDAQENGNKRGPDSGLDNVEEERDKEEKVQKEMKDMPKCKKRSTGRPIGRPKRNSADDKGETRRRRSNTKTAKLKVQMLKRTRCSDEESEDEHVESDMSFDLTEEEEEENSEKVTSSTSRARRKANNSDSDSDFDPEERKKRRYSSQNRGKSSGKRRGRPRKNQVDQDAEH